MERGRIRDGHAPRRGAVARSRRLPRASAPSPEKDPTLAALAERIRALRAEAKITQEEFAIRAVLSLAYVSMLERGARSPSLDTLAKVARALDVPLPELFRARADEPYEDPYFERLVAFAQAARLNRRQIDRLIVVGCAMFDVVPGALPMPPDQPGEEPISVCSIQGCGRPVLARGLCPSHYQKRRREKS